MKKVFNEKHISTQKDNGAKIYDLDVPKNTVTLSDFIEQVVEDKSKFGVVYINVDDKDNEQNKNVCISYTGGEVKFNKDKFDMLKDSIVDNDGYANEVYGSTDYFIKVKK